MKSLVISLAIPTSTPGGKREKEVSNPSLIQLTSSKFPQHSIIVKSEKFSLRQTIHVLSLYLIYS